MLTTGEFVVTEFMPRTKTKWSATIKMFVFFAIVLVVSACILLIANAAYNHRKQLIESTINEISVSKSTGNTFYLFKAEITWKDVDKNVNYVTSVLVAMEKTGVNASALQSLSLVLDEQERQDSLWKFLVRKM